jgi:hypothetical protein
MNRLLSSFLLLGAICFGALFVSCTQNQTTASSGGGDVVPGDFRGALILYDSVGQAIQDKSGVLVELGGTQYSTVTDANGQWVFHNIPTRTYALKFSKASFITRTDQFTYVGGGTTWYSAAQGYLALRQSPAFQYVFDAVVSPESANATFYFHTTGTIPANNNYGLFLAGSTTPFPLLDDSSTRPITIYNSNAFTSQGAANSFSASCSGLGGLSYYYGHGATLYLRLFAFVGSYDYDIDPITQQQRYVNCGPGSNVLSVVLP